MLVGYVRTFPLPGRWLEKFRNVEMVFLDGLFLLLWGACPSVLCYCLMQIVHSNLSDLWLWVYVFAVFKRLWQVLCNLESIMCLHKSAPHRGINCTFVEKKKKTKYIVNWKNLVNQFKPKQMHNVKALFLRQFCSSSSKRLVRLNCSWFRLNLLGRSECVRLKAEQEPR